MEILTTCKMQIALLFSLLLMGYLYIIQGNKLNKRIEKKTVQQTF